jgi:hypothetical protein
VPEGKEGVYRYHFARISQRDLSPIDKVAVAVMTLPDCQRNQGTNSRSKSRKLYFQYNAQVNLRRRMFAADILDRVVPFLLKFRPAVRAQFRPGSGCHISLLHLGLQLPKR